MFKLYMALLPQFLDGHQQRHESFFKLSLEKMYLNTLTHHLIHLSLSEERPTKVLSSFLIHVSIQYWILGMVGTLNGLQQASLKMEDSLMSYYFTPL